MNSQERIRAVLTYVANEGIRGFNDIWPRVALAFERDRRRRRLSAQVVRMVVLVLVASMTLAGAAYAFYWLMIDPGLQHAADAGLVAEFSRKAGATAFPLPSAGAGNAFGSTLAPSGLSVVLDWAYADASRLGLQLTIRGLFLPVNISPSEIICRPQLTSGEGIIFGSGGFSSQIVQRNDLPERPVEAVFVFNQSIDSARTEKLSLVLDLTVGPCASIWNTDETIRLAETPPPLVGIYHMEFQVPVYRSVTIFPRQEVTANGISMRIESVRLTPSFTTIRLCYELPAGAEVVSSDQWAPEITVRVGDGEPVGEASVPSDYATDRTGLRCADIGFAVAYEHGPATLVVSVQRLSTELPAVISEDLALAAARNLNNEGIEVQFLEIGRGVEWDVLRKPAGMSEEVAYELIVNALRKHIEGPWVFQVGISH